MSLRTFTTLRDCDLKLWVDMIEQLTVWLGVLSNNKQHLKMFFLVNWVMNIVHMLNLHIIRKMACLI